MAQAIFLSQLKITKTFLRFAVIVRVGRVSAFRSGINDCVQKLIFFGQIRNVQQAASPPVIICPCFAIFRFFEVRQNIIVRPTGTAQL